MEYITALGHGVAELPLCLPWVFGCHCLLCYENHRKVTHFHRNDQVILPLFWQMTLSVIYFTCFLGRFYKLALDNIGCVRHCSSKLGSALTGTMFDDTLLYLREDFFVRLQQHSGLWCQPTLEARAEAKICLDYALQGGGRRSQ